MPNHFQALIDAKRAELELVRLRCDELERDIAALERVGAMQAAPPPPVPVPVAAPETPTLSKKERHARRLGQVLALFRRHEGVLHLSTIMSELKVSKNAAKEWMNVAIDKDPAACPWERLDGNKSRFVLKEYGPRV